MRKRITSLLLAFCLFISVLPINAIAAWTQEEEALYLQMLELGLVDADGALIENNSFTVEDGTKLASLTELEDWLAQCDEDDFTTVITVDATGKSATAEQIFYALSLEYDINDLADQLNLLANGEGVSLLSAADTFDTTYHELTLGIMSGVNLTDDTISLNVNLYKDGSLCTSHDDVVVEVGLFSEFTEYDTTGSGCGGTTVETLDGNLVTDDSKNSPGKGYFKELTIADGESSLSFTLDMGKIRENFLSSRTDIWDGNAYMLFEARAVSGMPECTDYRIITLAPQSETDEIVSWMKNGFMPAVNDYENVAYIPYSVELNGDDEEVETTINNQKVDAFTIPVIYAKDNKNQSELQNIWERAISNGVGDAEPMYLIKDMSIITTYTDNSWHYVPSLYYLDDTELIKANNGGSISVKRNSTSDTEYIQSVAATYYGNWEYSSSGNMKNMYENLRDGKTQTVRFYNVKIPVYDDGDTFQITHKLYMEATGWNDTQNDLQGLCVTDKVYLADSTAPTVVSIETDSSYYASLTQTTVDENFYSGNVIPITVTFSEPVYGDYALVYQSGTDVKTLTNQNTSDSITNSSIKRDNADNLSRTRTFYYVVSDTDGTKEGGSILIKGVQAQSSNCTDIYGNTFENDTTDTDGIKYQEKTTELLKGKLFGTRYEDSIVSMSAETYQTEPDRATVTVELKNKDAFKTLWANSAASETYVVKNANIVLDGDTSTTYECVLTEKQNKFYLTCEMTLPSVESSVTHLAELYIDGDLYYGAYTTFVQKPTVFADSSAYTISTDRWPSGLNNVIYIQDQSVPVFTYVDNGTDFTYKNNDQIYWESSDDTILSVNTTGSALENNVSVTAHKEGTVTLMLKARNNAPVENTDSHTQASNIITITVKDGGSPTLQFPINADTFYAQHNTELTVNFSSNLYKFAPDDGKITVELYTGSAIENDAKPVYENEIGRSATSLTIPQSYIQNISTGDVPAYILRLTASAEVDGKTVDFVADAKIIVRSQPAAITLTGLDNPLFTSSQTIVIGWNVENFDLQTNPEKCQFQLTVEKDGEAVYHTDTLSEQGSFELPVKEPDELKDYYVVTAKAKNGSDPTWSIASSTITVYKDGALKILVDGESVDSVTLKNTVTGDTTTSPVIVNNEGKTLSGLNNAQAIAALRSELGLMDSISINFEDYNWSSLYDMIQWETTTGQNSEITDEIERAVTINYRYGMLYQPLEKLQYTKYLPQTILMLCGLREGSNTVTAAHSSLAALSDSVEVSIERLENKLYLFQFTPAVKTEVTYVDGQNKTHTVYSNDDGSLALFEPDGISSDLMVASISDGTAYRGTLSRLALKSGEGDGTQGELYPLNNLELRLAATAQVTLLKPDGTPLANTDITLRGGVYRNMYKAKERDDAYCAGAMFAKEEGQTASLDGKKDQTFTTDENGVLTVHMDLEQFISANDTKAVGVGDSLEFIFELSFANDEYYPEIVTVNGSLTKRDTMRSGEDIVTLTAAQKAKPFIAVQTIDYTGRDIDVRKHTGVVGPSSNYPEAKLETAIMLWGTEGVSVTDTGYYIDLRDQETGISLPSQQIYRAADASYPFSSIPLVSSNAVLSSESFIRYDGTKKTVMEVAVYNGSGQLTGTVSMPFGLADFTTIEKVEDSASVISLMANIAAYGSIGGADDKYGLGGVVSDFIMNDALSFLEELGGKTGLVKAVLTPTEDPTRYSAYLWTGIDNTSLKDLDYDTNGISVEPSYIGQDYDSLLGEVSGAFSLSDFQSMADGSYFDNISGMYGQVSRAVGLRAALVLEGWMSTEIRYNFDKGEWQVITTGGGFTAGAQVEYEKFINIKSSKKNYSAGVTVGSNSKIPWTASFKVRGGVVVDFKTALRYAEQLGLEWNDDTADVVNDYLTSLRINAYFELFGGIGIDKGFVAKIGAFGTIEIDNENRFLTRNYLKDETKQDVRGQFLNLNGEAGIRASLGVGPLVTEITVVSLGFNKGWSFNGWKDIAEYWEEASSGLGSTGWMDEDYMPQSMRSADDDYSLIVADAGVKLQSRDYLTEAERTWTGGINTAVMSLDEQSKLAAVETNSYPYSSPMISDDGSILVYLSDADSTDVTDAEIRYSLTDGGSFPNGTAIPDGADGFEGYGDSSLDFDGTADYAGAVWLREAATVGLKADAELNESQQMVLLNGLEVMASIWDGNKWTTTRLTDNGTEEFNPVIAVNESGQAIAAWRSVQVGDSSFEFTRNRILCKLYDGTDWSEETYTLYNGSAGDVTGMTAEMLADGTAAIAFSIEDAENGNDIYYTVVDTASENIEDNAKTIRATTNTYTDENPQLTTVGDKFVLGWSCVQDQSGLEQYDVGLRVFDRSGAPQDELPDSLSNMVSLTSFDGQFTFVKGTESLEALSILWNDANAGDDENDVIKAVKFDLYNGSYGASAPVEVAKLPARTDLNHMDAYTTSSDGTGVHAIIQSTTYSDTEYETISYSYEVDGKTYEGSGRIPKETVNLYSATENYTDAVEVSGINVDYTTLTTNSYVPVQFAVTNQGINVMNSVTVSLAGAEDQTFTDINLLPGETKNISAVIRTGNVIENIDYKVTATFDEAITRTATGTVYLDYPDVGISALTVVKEQEGARNILVSMYNQSAASLNKSNRRVILGVYSDPECETPVNGKYLADGTTDTAYELILTGDALAAIDDIGYTSEISFDMESYISDSGLDEIPDGGVQLFVKAQIQQQVDGEWIELPEADSQNNQKSITFDSLLNRNGNIPTTVSVEIDNDSATTALVQIRNNSMQSTESGKLLAALLDENGNIIESKNIGNIELGCEDVKEFELKFSQIGERVVLRYGESSNGDNTNANADSITISGLQLSMDSFDANGNATITTVHNGSYLLTVIPEHVGATVEINGEAVENGMKNIVVDGRDEMITVTITAADGIASRTYKIKLKFAVGDINGDYLVTNADLIAFARYLVELVEFSDEQMALADFDGNGELNNTDLILLARYIVG